MEYKMIKNILFFLGIVLIISCKEIAPVVPVLGDRNILVEEFTGVRCVNCPAGASEIDNLQATYGERLIVVSIHVGDFAPPYSDSKYDFRTADGSELEKLLGAPIGYPSAVINRKKFSGQGQMQVLRSTWAGFLASESTTPSVLNLGFNKKYDKTTRKLDVNIDVIPTENLGSEVKLTVLITENGIKDQQETPQGKKSDYAHKHVFRKTLTRFDGDNIGILRKGETISKAFSYILPQNWAAENCKIVAFVHKSGTEKDILQVNEIPLQ
jgi:Outer membrane protein Omp28